MKTATTGLAALVLVAGTVALATSTRDPDDRKVVISCWWTPAERQGTLWWKFGARPQGSTVALGHSRNDPWKRSTTVKRGDVVALGLRFVNGGSTSSPGMFRECSIKAGSDRRTFKARNLDAFAGSVTAQ